jgi:Ca2+-binding RTX toxin-like protein
MSTTKNSLDALLYIRNGDETSRWNFADAVGSNVSSPGGIGNPAQITFSFLQKKPSYDAVTGFSKFSQDQIDATRTILSDIEKITGIDFVEVTTGGSITFANCAQSSDTLGYAYAPTHGYSTLGSKITDVSVADLSGDIWINNTVDWAANAWTAGQEGYVTILHEIGHALGLKHPFEADQDGYILETAFDSELYTLMSYDPAPKSTIVSVSGDSSSYSWIESSIHPTGFSMKDIEALQYLYGANTEKTAGDNVYKWDSNPVIFQTIWDSSGIDTFDCSNQVRSCTINLSAGSFSSIGYRSDAAAIRSSLGMPSWFTEELPDSVYDGSKNIAVAKNVVIENAYGGSDGDVLSGNDAGNTLAGNGGADKIYGLTGDDKLKGGLNKDILDGGLGTDTADYSDKTSTVKIILNRSTDAKVYVNGAAEDTIKNIENLVGGSGVDVLTGDAANNVLDGGADQVADVIDGGAGIDTISFGSITGTMGVTLSLGAYNATTKTTSQTFAKIGSALTDKINNVENITGSKNADILSGNAGDNIVRGEAGLDTLMGGLGTDSLHGGSDKVKDIFDFNDVAESKMSTARDRIYNFLTTIDKIDLSGIDANTKLSGDQGFGKTLGAKALANSLWHELKDVDGKASTKDIVIYGDVDGNMTADFEIGLVGVTAIAAGDLVL